MPTYLRISFATTPPTCIADAPWLSPARWSTARYMNHGTACVVVTARATDTRTCIATFMIFVFGHHVTTPNGDQLCNAVHHVLRFPRTVAGWTSPIGSNGSSLLRKTNRNLILFTAITTVTTAARTLRYGKIVDALRMWTSIRSTSLHSRASNLTLGLQLLCEMCIHMAMLRIQGMRMRRLAPWVRTTVAQQQRRKSTDYETATR